MTDGTSQGLFVVVAIVIFGIFVALSYTVFGSDGLSGDLAGIFDNAIERTEISSRRGDIGFRMSDADRFTGSDWNYNATNNTITMSNDASYRGGIVIDSGFFEYGKTYIMSFDITKLSGDIEQLGGHLRISNSTEVRINGEDTVVWYGHPRHEERNDWTRTVDYPNDTNKNRVDVIFTYDVEDPIDNPNVYIQINRSSHYSGKEMEFEVEISDLTIRER